MGKSTRWFLSLIGLKRSSKSSPAEKKPSLNGGAEEARKSTKDKRKWTFGKSQDPFENSASRSDYEHEQTKHAIAVAQASQAAAEAAVAAAHAAAAVVKLTETNYPLFELISREEWAAIKIQTAFRGCLARRALRALRAVVRIQALFRGHRVRKQAAITLRCMQALVRVQARVRARRVRMSQEGQAVQEQLLLRRLNESQGRSRKSVDGWNASTRTVEDLNATNQRRQQGVMKRERALAYAFAKAQAASSMVIDCEPDTPHWGWSWLERWMAARPWESPFDVGVPGGGPPSPTSTKIVEVDPAVQQLKRRSSGSEKTGAVPCVTPPQAPQAPPAYINEFVAAPVAHPAKTMVPLPLDQTNFDLSHPSPTEHPSGRTDRDFILDDINNIWSTNVKASPGFVLKPLKDYVDVPVSRDESDLPSYPSYMATTQSSKAKVRSHSTPKQRPDATPDTPRSRRNSLLSLSGECRSTNSGPMRGFQRNPHLRLSGKNFSGSVVLDRSLVSLMSANGDLRKPFRF